MNQIKEARIRKSNMKLYPFYNMIGLDLMFFYAIQILFLMQVKGFSASSAVLLGSFYALFAIILNIPLTMVVQKIGKRNGLVLGNIVNLVYIMMWIFCNEYFLFVIAEFFSAVAFALKGITENTLLNESIPETEKRAEIFTKISSKGYSKYSYFSAFGLLISGFLYDINPYIPLICAAICILISIILSANFIDPREIQNKKESEENKTFAEMLKDLKAGLKFIFKSQRIRALLLMLAVIWGIICLESSYRTTLLESIGCSATIIGIIAAVLDVIKGKASTSANRFNKRHGNKSLTIILLITTFSLIAAGTIVVIGAPYAIQLCVIILAFALMYGLKGIYQILANRYKNSFTTPELLTKIYSVDGITANIARMIITFIGSSILAATEIKYAIIIVGIIFTIVALLIAKYMKPRIGLKPHEYKKEDIRFEG